MPLYEYRCRECHHRFEVRQSVHDPHPECPECHSTEVIRIIHPTNVHYKGSGFYSTDKHTEKKNG